MSNHYNFIAPTYDGLAKLVFGNSIIKAQYQWLNSLPGQGDVLFVGGGSGKALKKLVESNPNLKITYVEPSVKMREKSKKALTESQLKQVTFVNQPIEDLKSDIQFDVIITFFFLDLFSEDKLDRIFNQLDQKLKDNGLWLVSEFNQPTNLFQRIIEKFMFLFLKITTAIEASSIADYKKQFDSKAYDLLAKEDFYSNFIYSNLYCKRSSKKNWHAN
jgi:ubiquinone/menaquinone biosynthesis C-methylase UbiE